MARQADDANQGQGAAAEGAWMILEPTDEGAAEDAGAGAEPMAQGAAEGAGAADGAGHS